MTPGPTQTTLTPTRLIDSDHPDVVAFALEHARGDSDRDRAVALYYAVRDGFRYDPYRVDLSVQGMRASTVISSGFGWCNPKAALLAAAARAVGIAARLGYADVRNHLSTERMRRMMQTDLFLWHGYTELWIDGAWRKATPAFNLTLCDKFGLLPLDFNGHDDSIYHPFDKQGNRHMEYVNQRGSFDDVPLDRIVADFERSYPIWLPQLQTMREASFLADVDREVQ
jgi:transglutaminase-like putative cysteine protease